jgi:RNA polymerase sigma-70 factor (ECF subfamily)
LDFADGRLAPSIEPAHELTAERLYERQWALSVLAQVYERLETEAAAAGKQDQFALLRRFLTGERVQGAYAGLAVRLRMSEGAIKVAVHRLRRKYRELLREEIGQTLADPADIDDEIRTLFDALAG